MGWYTRFYHPKAVMHGVASVVVFFVLPILLSYNIILSQTVSEKYPQLVRDERSTIGLVLKDIRSLPEFGKLFLLYKNKYGVQIEQEVFFEKRKDEELAKSLLKLLEQSPDSRDLNYNIAQLKLKTGKDGGVYLRKAREIDPGLSL